MTIEWVCKHHSDLGKDQLYEILRLRAEVFVVEQKCVYQDIDGRTWQVIPTTSWRGTTIDWWPTCACLTPTHKAAM